MRTHAGIWGMLVLLGCAGAQGHAAAEAGSGGNGRVRAELVQLYEVNRQAFLARDPDAVMALRADDFHSMTPDGRTHDRAAMELYIRGFINGVERWNGLTFRIDSLAVRGDTAAAIVTQHADRMALREDNRVHHVETWVTQRETWVRTRNGWRMWRVDQLRGQRRRVDGQPG
ncbi:nuclear transport factor 2 family protein [Longimicrobium sp.]|uniref:nuclear transport factor 2 family protein n=1 Tax=Longimicrobium sp. TaxID=2029185 RepID=UPI002ED85736